MAKGQVTDEELASGLRGMGGLGSLSPVKRDSPFRDSRSEPKTVEVPVRTTPRVVEPRSEQPKTKAIPQAQEPPVAAAVSATEKQARVEKRKVARRKADIHSERVTLQMSPAMRDEVDELARQLQRSKTSRDERITANTVMRVAIRVLLDNFPEPAVGAINSEEELFQTLRSHFAAK